MSTDWVGIFKQHLLENVFTSAIEWIQVQENLLQNVKQMKLGVFEHMYGINNGTADV